MAGQVTGTGAERSVSRYGSGHEGTGHRYGGDRSGGPVALLERNAFLAAVLAAGCATLARQIQRTFVSDTWYSLLAGRIVASSGVPSRDTLTVMTLGRRWVDQQWLAHLGLYELWRLGGWSLVFPLAIVLFLTSFAAVAACARRLGASDRSCAGRRRPLPRGRALRRGSYVRSFRRACCSRWCWRSCLPTSVIARAVCSSSSRCSCCGRTCMARSCSAPGSWRCAG